MAPALDEDDDADYADIDVDSLVAKHLAGSSGCPAVPSGAPQWGPTPNGQQGPQLLVLAGAQGAHGAPMATACKGVTHAGGYGQAQYQYQPQPPGPPQAQPLQPSNAGPQPPLHGQALRADAQSGSYAKVQGADASASFWKAPPQPTAVALPMAVPERGRPRSPVISQPAAPPQPQAAQQVAHGNHHSGQGPHHEQAAGSAGSHMQAQQHAQGYGPRAHPQLQQQTHNPPLPAQGVGPGSVAHKPGAPAQRPPAAPQQAGTGQVMRHQGQAEAQTFQQGTYYPQQKEKAQPYVQQHQQWQPQQHQLQVPQQGGQLHQQAQPQPQAQLPLQQHVPQHRQMQLPAQPQQHLQPHIHGQPRPPQQPQPQPPVQQQQQQQQRPPPPHQQQQPQGQLMTPIQLNPHPLHEQRPAQQPAQQQQQQQQQPQRQLGPQRQQNPHPLHEQRAAQQQQQQRQQQQEPQQPQRQQPHQQPPQPHNGQVMQVPQNPPGPGQGPPPPAAPPPPNRPVSFTASLAIEDKDRFSVKVGYHDGLQKVFGLISGAMRDNAVKGWTFPLSQYNHVMDALTDGRLRTRGVTVTIQETLPDFVKGMLKAAAARSNDERLYDKLMRRVNKTEQSLDERMMPFQREGVRHALRLGGRVLIGDEMGLGKTVQACCLLSCYSEDWPALIVVPKSLRETWADALFAWLKLTDTEVFVVHNVKDADQIKSPGLKPKMVVVSYDALLRISDKLKAMKFRMVVLDEAHYIKNGKAQRTKEALPLLQAAHRVVLLTGTPALSKPMELVPLLQALMPAAGIKANAFGDRYSHQDRRYPGKFFGTRNEGELNKLLQGTIMVRRLKKDVIKDLPPKRRQQIFIRLPDKETRQMAAMGRELEGIRQVMRSMDKTGGEGLSGIEQEKRRAIMGLWHETAKLKADAVAEYCSDLLGEGQDAPKFLLFAHHREVLNAVEEQVKKCKVQYIRIDGETPSEKRAEGVNRFQNDEAVKVAILSIKAAGVGLTMTASSLVVFAELSWVPGDIQQAEDRCHRIGQSSSVNVHFLLVRGSVDEIMWDTLQNKLGTVGKVLDGSGASMKVDATRELRGYGANNGAVRPGQGEASGGSPEGGPAGAESAGGGGPKAVSSAAASPFAGPAKTASAGGRGGPGRSPAPAPAGTRRISDFFARAGVAAGGKAATGTVCDAHKGTKRGREQEGAIEVLSDDERDFKKR